VWRPAIFSMCEELEDASPATVASAAAKRGASAARSQ
jgi:hypothetical protein